MKKTVIAISMILTVGCSSLQKQQASKVGMDSLAAREVASDVDAAQAFFTKYIESQKSGANSVSFIGSNQDGEVCELFSYSGDLIYLTTSEGRIAGDSVLNIQINKVTLDKKTVDPKTGVENRVIGVSGKGQAKISLSFDSKGFLSGQFKYGRSGYANYADVCNLKTLILNFSKVARPLLSSVVN